MSNKKSAYIAFDIFPSAKGAATHIYHFSKALFEYYGGGYLFVLGNEELPIFQKEENIEIHRFITDEKNYLKRATAFTEWLWYKLELLENIEVIHFRDIWGGLASLNLSKKRKYIFEVNALTSIELPYKYKILSTTLDKIREYELFCLKFCDKIIVPSKVIQSKLESLNVENQKITHISNGAQKINVLNKKYEKGLYIMYFGALQSWQGIPILLKAFANLNDWEQLKLVIASSNHQRISKPYKKLAEKLEIDNRIIWLHQLNKDELNNWLLNAYLTVAPLTETERNIEQGCSPLKVLESMAAKTTIVASDLQVVREILKDNETGKLVRPNRPAELASSIRFLLDNVNFNKNLAENAYNEFVEKYIWEKKIEELIEVYKNIL